MAVLGLNARADAEGGLPSSGQICDPFGDNYASCRLWRRWSSTSGLLIFPPEPSLYYTVRGQEVGHLRVEWPWWNYTDLVDCLCVLNHGQVPWIVVWTADRHKIAIDLAAWVISHMGHKFGTASEMDHWGFYYTITYPLFMILISCIVTYLMKSHEYFQDFRAALSYPTALKRWWLCKIRKHPFWGWFGWLGTLWEMAIQCLLSSCAVDISLP